MTDKPSPQPEAEANPSDQDSKTIEGLPVEDEVQPTPGEVDAPLQQSQAFAEEEGEGQAIRAFEPPAQPSFRDQARIYWSRLPTLKKAEDRLAEALKIKSSRDRFVFDMGFNFIIILIVVLFADSIFMIATRDVNSLYLYQNFMSQVMVAILNGFGVENNFYHNSDGSPVVSVVVLTAGWEIASVCTGLRETIFLSLLVLLFRDVRWQVRLRWVAIFSLIIFVENLVRILSGYPIEMAYGFAAWDRFHYYWWNVGQYFFIMALFLLWVRFVAHKDILQQRRERRRQEQQAQEESPALAQGDQASA